MPFEDGKIKMGRPQQA